MEAEGRNWKALGDIGNVSTYRGVEGKKSLPQVSRPLKRSFYAQLLANAQVAAGNQKIMTMEKHVVVKVKGANIAKVPAVRKSAQMKATGKTNSEEIIEISPDTREKNGGEDAKEEG